MGTILYMAPEQGQGKRYGKKIDIWACGVIMYFILTGKHPFYKPGEGEQSYIRRISEESLKSESLSALADSLFYKLCALSPSDRYTAM